ncbi:SIS domain-containing protein [Tissierella sp. Yu-01]|uniref:SIS domain-containing protein n=1 Tax=Tissierella sp. Yu-01 TaxID=3035694 RepID=UPI00240E6AE8|nr:SIS domain-containing protein [Tissierella sp. Yu-01]WFA09237.1 SIS domain-containing protein [Tissierella sp. Yu-01]
MFYYSVDKWRQLNGFHTATEISQQPELWTDALNHIESNIEYIRGFLKDALDKDGLRVIFTGAGSSSYIGDLVTPFLNSKERYIYESIPTTSIVTNPDVYFKTDIPTLLVSFARSGDSPESIAVYNLANQLINDVKHVFITCNKDGQLSKISEGNENILLILMPEKSNDKGFAMTSSFSCMTLTSLLIFNLDNFEYLKEQVIKMVDIGKQIIENGLNDLKTIIDTDFERIVYLSSSNFNGLAKESSLKLLELTRGQIVTLSETAVGFRHGPKSIIDDNTIIFVYISDHSYTRKYESDLLNEIYNDDGNHKIVAISNKFYSEISEICNCYISLDKYGFNIDEEGLLSLLYLIFAQIFALFVSIKTSVEPDNPNPSGKVNRVVKGINIYKFQ